MIKNKTVLLIVVFLLMLTACGKSTEEAAAAGYSDGSIETIYVEGETGCFKNFSQRES